MTGSEHRNRQPKGVSAGGQFAAESKGEAPVGLAGRTGYPPLPTAEDMKPEWKAASGLTFGTPVGDNESQLEAATRKSYGVWTLTYTTESGETWDEDEDPVRGTVSYTIDIDYGLMAIDIDSPTQGRHHQNIGTVAGFGDSYGGELLKDVSGIDYPHEWVEDAEQRLWDNPDWAPGPADYPAEPW